MSLSIQTGDLQTISSSQLKKFVEDLEKSTNSDELVLGFQFLGRFCTSVADSGLSMLETNLSSFVPNVIQKHDDKKVRIHAAAFLLTLSFSVGKYKSELVADTSLSLLSNLFLETKYPQNVGLVQSLGVVLNSLSSTPSLRSINVSVSIIDQLRLQLGEKNTSDDDKKHIVDLLVDILDGEFFAFIADRKGGSGGGGGGSGSSSDSDAAEVDYPPLFLEALVKLLSVLEAIASSSRKHLRTSCLGLIQLIKQSFSVQEKNEIPKLKKVEVFFSQVNKSSNIQVSNGGKTAIISPGNGNNNVIVLGDRCISKGVITISVLIKKLSGACNLLGIIKSLPSSYTNRLAHNGGGTVDLVLGWTLALESPSGVYSKGVKVADSSSTTYVNNVVMMVADVDKGNLVFSVGGTKCAELLGVSEIRGGVYLAANMYSGEFEIQSAEYVGDGF